MPQLEVQAIEQIESGKERVSANNELPSQLENYRISNEFQNCAEPSLTDDCNTMSIIESEDEKSICSSHSKEIIQSQSEILVRSSENECSDVGVPLGDISNRVDPNTSTTTADEPLRNIDSPNFEFSLDDSINLEDDLAEDNIPDEESVGEELCKTETSQQQSFEICNVQSGIEVLEESCETVGRQEYNEVVMDEETNEIENHIEFERPANKDNELEISVEPSQVGPNQDESSEIEIPNKPSEVSEECSETESTEIVPELEPTQPHQQPTKIDLHNQLGEIETNEEIGEIETHEDIFEVETYEELCKVEVCGNSSKVDIHENCCKVEICENSNKIEMYECSGKVEMCEESCKVEMLEEQFKVIDACQETCEEIAKVSASDKTEICKEPSKIEAEGEFKVEICEETCQIETCKVEGVNETIEGVNETIEGIIGETHLDIGPLTEEGKEVEDIESDAVEVTQDAVKVTQDVVEVTQNVVEVTQDADSTWDISRRLEEGREDLFCDISLYLPEEDLIEKDSEKESSRTSDVLPDSTQSKEIKTEGNKCCMEDQEGRAKDKEVTTQLNEETGEMEPTQCEAEKFVSVEKEDVNLGGEKCLSEVVCPNGDKMEREESVERKGDEEAVERLAMKEAVLKALGLKSLSAPVEKPKVRPLDSGYTGTLKAVIKLNRGAGDKKSRTMVYRRSDDRIPTDILEYRICTEVTFF
jgi:hypothetical protein